MRAAVCPAYGPPEVVRVEERPVPEVRADQVGVRVQAAAVNFPDVLIIAMDEPEKRLGQCGFLLGRHPGMKILALAPEQNRGIFYWAVVDIRTKPLESSEAGILNAVRERPVLVGAAQN